MVPRHIQEQVVPLSPSSLKISTFPVPVTPTVAMMMGRDWNRQMDFGNLKYVGYYCYKIFSKKVSAVWQQTTFL
jgi:hypothetical protein